MKFPPDASIELVDAVPTRLVALSKIQVRLQQRLDASRLLMDRDAVQTGSVHQEQQTRPVTPVDAFSMNYGRIRAEEQARPS